MKKERRATLLGTGGHTIAFVPDGDQFIIKRHKKNGRTEIIGRISQTGFNTIKKGE